MRDLTFAMYRNLGDVDGEVVEQSWEEWVELLLAYDVRGRPEDSGDERALGLGKDGPCVVLGRVEGKRKASSVREIHALGLDFDGVREEELDRALAALDPFEHVLYTTHKHGSKVAGPFSRVRVVLPLLEPLAPSKFKSAWKVLWETTGSVADEAAKDVSRVFFLPSTFDPSICFAGRSARERWISEADLQVARAVPLSPLDVFRRVRKNHELREPARAVVEGRSFATEGARHDTSLLLTWMLAKKSTSFSDDEIRSSFRASVEQMEGFDVEDVVASYRGAIEKVGEDSAVEGGPENPYTDAELDAIAERQGCAREDLGQRWVIQKKETYYVLCADGAYDGPIFAAEARPALAQNLARAPVRLNEPTKRGFRRRSVSEIVEDHGQCAREVVFDLTRKFTSYDATERVLYDATRPIREGLVPRFDESFDEFLRVFSGDLYDRLSDWVACAPDATKLLCALYLSGPPGVGKNFLVSGLAKLWHSGDATPLDAVLGQFNADLARCPLVIADEAIPHEWKWGNVTTRLRAMISAYQHNFSAKYMPGSILRGAMRLVLCANNDSLLRSPEVITPDDHEAIGQRFLYIEILSEAKDVLSGMSSEKRDALSERGIAEHALFLAQSREVVRGHRFWVEGDPNKARKMLLTAGDFHSLVCQWLVLYLMNPEPINAKNDGLIRIDKERGKYLVNVQAIIDGWTVYHPTTKHEPVISKVNRVLREVGLRDQRQLWFRGRRIRYREIDVERLFAWSERNDWGDRETMEVTLGLRKREEGADLTEDVASLTTVGKGAKEKLREMREQKRDTNADPEDPGLVDERGDRVPF
jgi:hypothetical protein